MSGADEPSSRAQQMQDKVRELNKRAERTSDPQERQKLQDQARRMQEQSMRDAKTAGGHRHRRQGSEKDEYPPE